MEIIPTKDLQNLANMLYEEESISLRSQLSAWVNSKAANPDHAPLSSLSAMAEQSTIKDKINEWVSNVTNPKPEFIYVPDMPFQIIEQPKIEEDAIQIGESKTFPLAETPVDSGTVEQGIPESEEPTQEGETKSEEETVKPKKARKKKVD